MLEKYKSSFAKDKYDKGTVRYYETRIDLWLLNIARKYPKNTNIEVIK